MIPRCLLQQAKYTLTEGIINLKVFAFVLFIFAKTPNYAVGPWQHNIFWCLIPVVFCNFLLFQRKSQYRIHFYTALHSPLAIAFFWGSYCCSLCHLEYSLWCVVSWNWSLLRPLNTTPVFMLDYESFDVPGWPKPSRPSNLNQHLGNWFEYLVSTSVLRPTLHQGLISDCQSMSLNPGHPGKSLFPSLCSAIVQPRSR